MGSAARPAIAIVGAGPAGLYTAQALRRLLPHADIAVIERLPAPYGLVRYGVAPDHQGTKAVTRQFDRLFERENISFFGNVAVDRDVPLAELRRHFDAVVIAAGRAADQKLDVPGETLQGVFGAGRVTRWFNSHPVEDRRCPEFGSQVVIIGNGNVALDLARLLTKSADEFSGSDLDPARLSALAAENVTEIDVVGRGWPEECKFDPALIREMGRLTRARIIVEWPANRSMAAAPNSASKLEALHAIDGTGSASEPRVVRFRFCHSPHSISGTKRVASVSFIDRETGRVRSVAATSVITAIGFTKSPQDLVLPDDCAGLYSVGWFRRGATGTIPEARADAQDVAQAVVKEHGSGGSRKGSSGLTAFLREVGVHHVNAHGWLRIRAAEEKTGTPGFIRRKLDSLETLLAAAQGWEAVEAL